MATSYMASVPKLLGRDNYEDWCFAVENFLVLEGLQKCLDGTETDTVQVAKAKAKLILTLDASLYVHVKEAASAKEVWDTLQKLYANKGFTRKISLLRNLISLRLENCDSMENYVNQIIETSQKLKSTGFDISPEWVGSLLLAGLPEKFSPMIMAIEHSGIAIDTETIKTKLLDMNEESSMGAKGGAFAIKQKKAKKNETSKLSKVKCYRCKAFGHYMNKCPKNTEGDTGDKTQEKKSSALSAVFLSGNFNATDWYIDSGASVHLTARKDWLTNITTDTNLKEIMVANKSTVAVICSGDIALKSIINDGKFHDVTIKNAMYVPELTTNLLSVSQLIKNGNTVKFNEKTCKIFDKNNKLIAEADNINNVYKLRYVKTQSLAGLTVNAEVLHRRFAHINYRDLNVMHQGAVDGLTCSGKLSSNEVCKVCCEGKQARLPFKHEGTRAQNKLEMVHADLCGPMEVPSLAGSRYFLLFEDDCTRYSFVYFIKNKDEVIDCFKEYKELVENQTNMNIKGLRTDNGGEFCNKQFDSFLVKCGIIHQKTNPHTPEQNGMLERLNRTIVEKARCLLFDADLNKSFWAEAVNTAVYLRNRSIASGIQKTPYEAWHNKKPDVGHIRIFGSDAMVHVPKARRTKFDKKSEKMILVGFSDNVKGYRLYCPETKKVITSRDVIIIEKEKKTTCVLPEIMTEPVSVGDIPDKNQPDDMNDDSEDKTSSSDLTFDSNFEDDKDDSDFTLPESLFESKPELPLRKSEREKKVKVYEDYVSYTCMGKVDLEDIPLTVQEALSRPDSECWKQAMEDEMRSFEENDAWDLIDIPDNGTVVSCKWVFKKKCDGDKVSYRARLVARGFTQKEGIDFEETFAPVIRYSSLRLLFALSLKLNLKITHLDVKTAFLNGFLKEDVLMRQPEGFIKKENANKVCKLKRAIYGLKQSSRAWNLRVDEVLLKSGFKKSVYEPCLYVKQGDNNLLTIIALYVDDFLVFSNDTKGTESLKIQLRSEFKIKDLGEVKQFLGMKIIRDDNTISLSQEQYIDQLLKRFNLVECNSVCTPLPENFDFNLIGKSAQNPLYQRLIGSLMYLAVLTRPDICFSVSFLSQFNNCATDYHWQCAKRILRYLKGTKDFSMKFEKDNLNLIGYVDADWGSNKIDRKSYTGYVFKFAGGSISWRSCKQKTVALSSTEAEYMAISEATKEAIYLRNLINDLIGKLDCVILFNDNQSARKLAYNPILHERSKHIDIRYHFIRNAVSDKIINIQYLSTNEMIADILTKILQNTKNAKFVQGLGLS